MTFILVTSIGILVLSASGMLPLIKVEFFPGNYFRYHLTISAPVGTAIEQTDAIVRDLSRYIMSLGAGQAHSTSGSSGYYEDQDYARHGRHFGQIVVTLPEEKSRDIPENPTNDPQQHLYFIRRKLAEFVRRQYPAGGVVPIVRVFKESDGPPTGKPVNIRVTGTTLADAVNASDRLKAFMQQNPELAGLAVYDSLLLIDFINVRLRRGKTLRQAIMESCATRMRPVLITTITTTLGLLPMAIGIPNRSISWAPIAAAFVPGLISATLLTLLITSANYEAFEQLKSYLITNNG
jgi:HAE1 family hydrophobic/amphiphilic exporter-1